MKNWKEKDLFNWLSKNHYKTLTDSKNTFSRWDCSDTETKEIIELKCREEHHEGQLLIEKKKYDAMMSVCKDNLYTPIYINSTPEGIYLWNLYDLEIDYWTWYYRKMKKTTDFSDNTKVMKEVTNLDVKNAIKLK